MRVRKEHPGSSSHGHVWEEPGQVLDIPVEDAAELVRIDPREFAVLPDESPAPEKPEDTETPDDPENPDGDQKPEEKPEPVTEPAPEPAPQPEEDDKAGDTPAKKAPARGGRRRVTED